MMLDQRELSLPVERTFQNQRPGASTSLLPATRTCTVSIWALKRRSRAIRRSYPCACLALCQRKRTCALAMTERGAGPACFGPGGLLEASAGCAIAAAAATTASVAATARSRVEENLPILRHIDADMCGSLPRVRGRALRERPQTCPGRVNHPFGPDRDGPQSSVRRPRTSASERPSRERNQKPRPTPSETSITCSPTANAIAWGKSIG